ncbi:MAG: hypothetical protein WA979_14005 [Pacificimonas sp.]
MTRPLAKGRSFARWYRDRCLWPNGEGPERLANCLRFCGWTATNILIVLGLPFLLLLAITGFSFELTLLQIDNLTDRFADAGPVRRAAFEDQCRLAAAFALAVICVLRWPGLVMANGGGAQ